MLRTFSSGSGFENRMHPRHSFLPSPPVQVVQRVLPWDVCRWNLEAPPWAFDYSEAFPGLRMEEFSLALIYCIFCAAAPRPFHG